MRVVVDASVAPSGGLLSAEVSAVALVRRCIIERRPDPICVVDTLDLGLRLEAALAARVEMRELTAVGLPAALAPLAARPVVAVALVRARVAVLEGPLAPTPDFLARAAGDCFRAALDFWVAVPLFPGSVAGLALAVLAAANLLEAARVVAVSEAPSGVVERWVRLLVVVPPARDALGLGRDLISLDALPWLGELLCCGVLRRDGCFPPTACGFLAPPLLLLILARVRAFARTPAAELVPPLRLASRRAFALDLSSARFAGDEATSVDGGTSIFFCIELAVSVLFSPVRSGDFSGSNASLPVDDAGEAARALRRAAL